MKKLYSVTLLLLFFVSVFPLKEVQAQELTTFILVRHAEIVDTDDSDPELSEIGEARTDRLAAHLESTNLAAVYSTPYNRTRSTVQAIADVHDLQLLEYEPFAADVLDHMLAEHRGGIILIAGHSNTTPALVNKLMGSHEVDQLDESEYDKLFIVTVSEIGKGHLVQLTY